MRTAEAGPRPCPGAAIVSGHSIEALVLGGRTALRLHRYIKSGDLARRLVDVVIWNFCPPITVL